MKSIVHSQFRIAQCLVLGSLVAGCGAGPQREDEPATEVTQTALSHEMLTTALDEQATFETMGAELSVRAWLSADAYVAQYRATSGAVIGTQRIGKQSLVDGVEVPKLLEGEPFRDFAARAGHPVALRVTGLPVDQLWFEPPLEPSGDIGTTRAASTLEDVARALAACNSKALNSCKENFGYTALHTGAPSFMFDWSYTANPTFHNVQHGLGGFAMGSGTGNATARSVASYSAVCAGAQTATLALKITGARFGLQTPGSFNVQAPPLSFVGLLIGEGWRDSACSGSACDYAVQFNQAQMSYTASPGNGIETFCGHFTDQGDVFHSFRCPELALECPDFTSVPEATNGAISN